MGSHKVTPHGHACGYSSRLVAGRCIGPESQHMQFLVTTTPGDDWISGHPNQQLTSKGTLIKGILGQ